MGEEKNKKVPTAVELLARAESARPIVDHAPNGVVRRGTRTLGLRYAEVKVGTEVASDSATRTINNTNGQG